MLTNVSLTVVPSSELVTIASKSSSSSFREMVDPSDCLVPMPPVIGIISVVPFVTVIAVELKEDSSTKSLSLRIRVPSSRSRVNR